MPFRLLPVGVVAAVATATRSVPQAGDAPSQEVSQRAEVEVEIRVLQAELGLELVHSLREAHEGEAETLGLVVVERPPLHPPKRLALHQLAQQLDQRQHELREPLLDLLRVGFDTARRRGAAAAEIECCCDRLRHCPPPPKLYGAQGPVHVTDRCGCSSAKARTASAAAATCSRATR